MKAWNVLIILKMKSEKIPLPADQKVYRCINFGYYKLLSIFSNFLLAICEFVNLHAACEPFETVEIVKTKT